VRSGAQAEPDGVAIGPDGLDDGRWWFPGGEVFAARQQADALLTVAAAEVPAGTTADRLLAAFAELLATADLVRPPTLLRPHSGTGCPGNPGTSAGLLGVEVARPRRPGGEEPQTMHPDQNRPVLYHTARRAVFAAAAAHGLNLAMQTAVAMIAPLPEFVLPAEASGHAGFAAAAGVGALLWGAGIAAAVIALTRLTGRVGVLAELCRATGLVGAGGLMLGGGAVLAQYGAAAGGIAEAGGGDAVQRAIFASTFVLNTAGPFLTVLALGGWLMWFAGAARRAGVIGTAWRADHHRGERPSRRDRSVRVRRWVRRVPRRPLRLPAGRHVGPTSGRLRTPRPASR
jgi:hypothetical protein